MPDVVAELQQRIGSRVRRRRLELGDTVKALAQRAALSPRFLADVETGRANISVVRLAELACALDVPIASLLSPTGGGSRRAIESLLADCDEAELERALAVLEVTLSRRTPRVVALLGMRGAGKSTAGPPLAHQLGHPFVELTDRIEARAGMALADIFTLHGEDYYRSVELACFAEVVHANEPCVVALPGGIVTSDAALALLRASCTAVWLKASADDYWSRVFAQGDTRPMAGLAHPMADLRALIRRRDPLYRQADVVVDTSDVPPDEVVSRILVALDASKRRP